MLRALLACLLALVATSGVAATHAVPAAPPESAATTLPTDRPRIALVLSGGGARGLAHVGVLKVLERERVPIDVIAGTSMGAIIGGLYASGMSARDIERELLQVRWGEVFSARVERPSLSQRRKEEDFEISPLIEFGLRDGELRAPTSAVSSRGLESLLRRLVERQRPSRHFDSLPIAFRAVATDLETGRPVVLSEGDLALAMRSSMSVPGVFSPTEVDGRVLGDGGLVDNLPVDVARAMGADIVIAVNVGTPLADRSTLDSVLGITAQMINILTEQNVQRSLSHLGPRDLLIAPDLGALAAADFERAREFIAHGEQGADVDAPRLAGLALTAPAYAQWRARALPADAPTPTLGRIAFEGSTLTHPQRIAPQLESQPGQPFDAGKAERDARLLAASGDYLRADYQLLGEGEDAAALVFELEDKPWGPNYFRIGLDLSTDFSGRSAFNIKISHNRHWLDPQGSEWRNRVQIGAAPLWFTELYRPLELSIGPWKDWFVAAYSGLGRERVTLYERDEGEELAAFRRTSFGFGIDLGQPWGRFGELRAGLAWRTTRTSPALVSARYGDPGPPVRGTEAGLRLRAVVDQLDYANFPQHGYRLSGDLTFGDGSRDGSFRRLEASATQVLSWDRHTINLHAMANGASRNEQGSVGAYSLGGFHRLSGYRLDQLNGNYVALGRLTWYTRLTRQPVFTRGFFVGASLEAGNAWDTRRAVDSRLRTGMSLFIGADTALGPLYVGLTHAPRGNSNLALFIGRP